MSEGKVLVVDDGETLNRRALLAVAELGEPVVAEAPAPPPLPVEAKVVEAAPQFGPLRAARTKQYSPITAMLDKGEHKTFIEAAAAFSDRAEPGHVGDARHQFHRYALGIGIALLADEPFLKKWFEYAEQARAIKQEPDMKQFAVIMVRAGKIALDITEADRKRRAGAIVVPDRMIVTPQEHEAEVAGR